MKRYFLKRSQGQGMKRYFLMLLCTLIITGLAGPPAMALLPAPVLVSPPNGDTWGGM